MKKKFLAIALLAGTMALSATAFTGCNKSANYSETFEGVVSESTYDSKDDAAKGFLEEELSVGSTKAELTEYNKEKDLSDSEITELKISTQVDGTIDSVEKGKISYTQSEAQRTYAAAVDNEENVHVVTVYIITYSKTGSTVKSYKYFAPLPEKGEALSASYYNSVLGGSKYENCTVTATSKSSMTSNSNYVANVQYVMSIDRDKAHVKLSIYTSFSAKMTISMYFVDTPTGLKSATSNNGEPYEVDYDDFAGMNINSVSDLYSSQLTEAQCSLFVKTDYGFRLKGDALEKLFNHELDASFSGNCDYYVVEGRIDRAVCNYSIKFGSGASSTSTTAKGESKFSKFGSTTVTIPNEVKTLLGIE